MRQAINDAGLFVIYNNDETSPDWEDGSEDVVNNPLHITSLRVAANNGMLGV
jgi:hypothetical protein